MRLDKTIQVVCICLVLIISTQAKAIVSSFPYAESFESGLGDWSNEEGDDFDWTWTNSATPSAGTGPDQADNLDYYVFTESSTPNHPSRDAHLEATFDFSALSSPEFIFKYHMYGAGTGSLHIDVYDGSWNLSEWSISGQQHSSASDSYSEQVVDLSAYASQSSITIRIRGITGTGSGGWRSDMAVDYVRVRDNCSAVPGTVTISDSILCAAGTVDLSLTGQGAGTLQWQQSTDDFSYTDISGATSSSHTTSTLSAGNTYYFRMELTNGCVAYSDVVSVNVGGSSLSLPYDESFESGTGGWQDYGSEGNNVWIQNSGGTPSGGTGPSGASDGAEYMFVESSNPNFNSTAVMEQFFDLSGVSSPEIEFDYHMYGSNMGSLTLEVDGNVEWSVSGQQHGSSGAAWTQQTVDLSAYAGSCPLSIKFIGVTGSSYRSDMAVDNISVFENCTTNGGTATVSSNNLCSPGTVDLSLSGQDAGAIQWQESTDSVFWNNISGATSANYTTSTLSGGETYFFRAIVSSGCSGYSNGLEVSVAPATSIELPYAESFENGFGDWDNNLVSDDNDWLQITGETHSDFTGPSGANDGVYYMYVEATNPFINSTAILEATFDFTVNNDIDFQFDYHMYGADMGSLALQVNGNTEWSISGQQHTDQTDPWTTQSVDLSAYAGQCNVRISFVGSTGSDYRSDIGLDNIVVTNPCALNAGTTSTSISSMCSSESVDLTLSGQDAGSIQWQRSTDNITYSDLSGATSASYTDGPLTLGNTYYYRSRLVNGCPAYSDTSLVNAQATAGDIATPYVETFETDFGSWDNVASENNDWNRRSGGTPSTPNTGPAGAQSGTYYLYVEGSSPYFNSEARLVNSIDLDGASEATFGFYYHMFGSTMGSLSVEVNGDVVWSVSGQQHSSVNDPWTLASIDLSAYLGDCNLPITFVANTGSAARSDIAIDSVFLNSTVFTWTGNNGVDWNDPLNWSGGFPDGSKSVVIPDVSGGSNNFPNLNSGADGTTIDLTIDPGATVRLGGSRTLDVSQDFVNNGTMILSSASSGTLEVDGNFINNATFTISGSSASTVSVNGLFTNDGTFSLGSGNSVVFDVDSHWINNGPFSTASGQVVFNGLSTQTISGSSPSVFYDMQINNTTASGVQVQSPTFIRGALTLDANSTFDNQSSFTLLSNATGTARLDIVPASATYTGGMTMERYFVNSQRQWRYLSSPFTDVDVSQWQDNIDVTGIFTGASTGPGLSNNASMFWYDETNSGDYILNGYTRYPQTTNTELINNGAGYATYVRNTPSATIDATGTPRIANGGAFSFNLSFTDYSLPAIDGWNLIGNPFPSNIDWSSGTGWTSSNVDNAIYFTDNETGDFVSYVFGISVPFGASNGVIPSGQAFWVHANAPGPTLTADENVKTGTSPSRDFYRIERQNLVYFELELPSGAKEQTCTHFSASGSELHNPIHDALAMHSPDTAAFGVWTINSKDEAFTISTLPQLDNLIGSSIPLWVNTDESGLHTIRFKNAESLSSSANVYLIDKLLGDTIEVSENNEHHFQIIDAESNSIKDRFEITFDKNVKMASDQKLLPEISIYPNPVTNGVMHFEFEQPGSADMTIFNSLGQLVHSQSIESGFNAVEVPASILPGAYTYVIKGSTGRSQGVITIQ